MLPDVMPAMPPFMLCLLSPHAASDDAADATLIFDAILFDAP
jgi:hypothetical protein